MSLLISEKYQHDRLAQTCDHTVADCFEAMCERTIFIASKFVETQMDLIYCFEMF